MHKHACILYSVACINVSAPTHLNSEEKKIKLLGHQGGSSFLKVIYCNREANIKEDSDWTATSHQSYLL